MAVSAEFLDREQANRDAAIFSRRGEGRSYEEIGQEFKLSGERVRQIISAAKSRAARFQRLAPLRAAFAKGMTR
jgi:DNA-directed RNA polymerase sigma subunit (sigma70/sigma32)